MEASVNLVQRIKELKRYELINFFNLVFSDREELGPHLLKLIRKMEAKESEIVLKTFQSLTDISLLIEEMNALPDPESSELETAALVIEEVFEITLPKIIKEVTEHTKKLKDKVIQDRDFLKAELAPFYLTDQMAGVDFPPVEKQILTNDTVIELPAVHKDIIKKSDIFDCIKDRESHRLFSDQPLNLDELAFLLWATQGIRQTFNNQKQIRRTVPSGGSRHPFETYLAVHNVSGLDKGIYRYSAVNHQLIQIEKRDDLNNLLTKYSYDQDFVGNCAVTFIWSVIPYRTEWRYGLLSKKDILLDCGHLCQNLYLACEAILCGTCAICAYKQKEFDELLRLDGTDEFTIYLSPVGKVNQEA
jgi:SagB-type dehydrogenase family enzyme